MGECKTYDKKEIKNMMKHIPRLKEDGRKKEQFKQLFYFTEKDGIDSGQWYPYVISSYGRLFSMNYKKKKGLIHQIKTHTDKNGYEIVPVNYKGHKFAAKMHRMVAISFIKNKDIIHKDQVNHCDGNKHNNHYWNLEWCTCKENIKHSAEVLLNRTKGEDHYFSKYTEKDIIKVCKMLEQNKSLKYIEKKTGMCYSSITNILYKRGWVHISKNYNFDNYNYGKPDNYDELFHQICKIAETHDYSMREISRQLKCNYYLVQDILHGRTHKDISKQYNLTKYQTQ